MKKQTVILRRVHQISDATIRRFVQEKDKESIVVELPDDMSMQDAQYLAAQALSEAYIWKKMTELTITTLRSTELERDEYEQGIEELLANLEMYWEREHNSIKQP